MYNKTVEDCFFKVQHSGLLNSSEPLTVHFRTSQNGPVLVIIDLYLQCDANGLIRQARFKTNGNPFVIAALEWLCRRIENQELITLSPLDYRLIITELAIPTAHYPIALQVEDTYKEAVLLMKRKFEDYKL